MEHVKSDIIKKARRNKASTAPSEMENQVKNFGSSNPGFFRGIVEEMTETQPGPSLLADMKLVEGQITKPSGPSAPAN